MPPRRTPRVPSPAALRLAAAALAIAFATACDSTAPTALGKGGGTGSLRITSATTGSYVDADGYLYAIDTSTMQTLPANGTLLLDGLAAGSHALTVSGIADNCTVAGGNSRSVAIADGTVADVTLAVVCAMPAVTHPAGIVVATRTLSGEPYGVAVSSTGVVYTALIGTSELIKGDLASMSFGSLVTVGSTPPHVAINPAGTTAYATLQYGQGLAIVDVATNTLRATIPFASDGFNLIVSPDGARVYATAADGTLYVIDAATRSVVATLNVGAAANGLAFSPDAKTLYVSSRNAGTVTAVSTATNAATKTYTLGGMPQRLAVSPDGSELYVANEVSGLNVVTVATGAVGTVSFGTAAYGLGMTPDGAQLYVLLPDAGAVVVLNRSTRAQVKTISVGGRPRNVAFDLPGRTALVTNEQAVVFIQ